MWAGVCMIWDISFPYALPIRVFVRYKDLLSCNHLSCLFFSAKSSFAIFQTEERILRKAQKFTSYLQNLPSLFAFLGPLATRHQKNVSQADIWHRNQNRILKWLSYIWGGKFCWKLPIIWSCWYFSRKKNRTAKIPASLERIWREQWNQKLEESVQYWWQAVQFSLKLTL